MVYEINENKLTLYRVKINKSRLKAIKKTIISKYGITDGKFKSLNRENFRMYANMYREEITPIVTSKRYNRNNELIEKTFYQVTNPLLASTIIKILNNPDSNLQSLIPFIEKDRQLVSYEQIKNPQCSIDDPKVVDAYNAYLKAKSKLGDPASEFGAFINDCIFSKSEEKTQEESVENKNVNDPKVEDAYKAYLEKLKTMDSKQQEDIRSGRTFLKAIGIDLEETKKYPGIEYLPSILENIVLIKAYELTFADLDDLYNKLKELGVFVESKIEPRISQKVLIK